MDVTSQLPDKNGIFKTFHFRNHDRKERFIRTILAHRYPVEFSEKEEEIKPTRELLMELEDDPIQYAVSETKWAKEVTEEYRNNHLTDEEIAYILRVAS